MYQRLDFAIGFFITVACLSSVMLALTLIHVSRLKSRPNPEDGVTVETSISSAPGETSESTEQPGQPEIWNLAPAVQTHVNLPNPPPSTIVPSKTAQVDEAAAVDQSKTTGARVVENERAGSNSRALSEEATSPELAPYAEVRSEIPSLETKELSVIKTVTARVAPAEIGPIATFQKEELNISLSGTGTKQASDAAGPGNSYSPSITVVNNSEVKDTMADKPNGDQTRDVKQDTSFSDLFTEDTEETEATRLGKELSDIDAGDIVKVTQSLAIQMKVRRPATKHREDGGRQ